MEKRRLGKTGMVVTDLCYGTMTFGSRNTEAEAFALLDRAYDAGIDFYDTAELYPVPPKAEWMHRTEEIVGEWLQTKDRDSVIIASKVAGPGHGWFSPPIRGSKTALDAHQIRRAIEASLERLQTDYIDLYQTHWPDHDFGYEETLDVLQDLKDEGLIRAAGCSNENAWGLMKATATADALDLIRYETIQNNYSILNRRFEDELANICRREQISCLPYAPLGGGVCTGKYNQDPLPDDARYAAYLKMKGQRQEEMAKRYVNEKSLGTVDKLAELAKEAGLELTPMCLAWSRQNDFVASTIFGATTMEQMEENLKAKDLILPDDVLQKIDEITKEILYPMG